MVCLITAKCISGSNIKSSCKTQGVHSTRESEKIIKRSNNKISHHLILKSAKSDEGWSDHIPSAHGNTRLPLEDSCCTKLEEESRKCFCYLWSCRPNTNKDESLCAHFRRDGCEIYQISEACMKPTMLTAVLKQVHTIRIITSRKSN